MRWQPHFTSARETSPAISSLTWLPSPCLQVSTANKEAVQVYFVCFGWLWLLSQLLWLPRKIAFCSDAEETDCSGCVSQTEGDGDNLWHTVLCIVLAYWAIQPASKRCMSHDKAIFSVFSNDSLACIQCYFRPFLLCATAIWGPTVAKLSVLPRLFRTTQTPATIERHSLQLKEMNATTLCARRMSYFVAERKPAATERNKACRLELQCASTWRKLSWHFQSFLSVVNTFME